MKKLNILLFILIGGLLAVSCDKNNGPGEEQPSEYKIITNGNGAVSAITTEGNDNRPLKIVQTIPSFTGMTATTPVRESRGTKYPETRNTPALGTFPANLPIIFFFDDKIYLNSVVNNIQIIVDGKQIFGTIIINEGANGYAILTFTPYQEFNVNSSIEVTVKKGLQDKNGNEMDEDFSLIYQISPKGEGEFSGNNGFESGSKGVLFIGDGSIMSGNHGSLIPQEGNKFAAISSGDNLVSPNGNAVGGATSTMILGPINKDFTSLTFYYDFVSAEFNDFVGSIFDDVAMITIYGPKGSHSEFITSVNTVRENNQPFTGFPNMPDNGDSYAGHTGWVQRKIDFSQVGTPAYITFIVTDVSDHILSSILAVDNLSY